MNKETTTLCKNDIVFTFDDKFVSLAHKGNKYPLIYRRKSDASEPMETVFKINSYDISVLVDTLQALYFIVNEEGKVMSEPLKNYDEAVEKAESLATNYKSWLKLQSMKGFTKKQLVEDAKKNILLAKKTYSKLHHSIDKQFYPLVKTNGRGTIDIIRNNVPSYVFHLDSIPSNLITYKGDKLFVYRQGYRLWNEKEKEVMKRWENMRDHEAEYADLISDGSAQFWRKMNFFKENGCEHLIGQTYNGLVKDANVRMCLDLTYDIRKMETTPQQLMDKMDRWYDDYVQKHKSYPEYAVCMIMDKQDGSTREITIRMNTLSELKELTDIAGCADFIVTELFYFC